MDSHSPRTWLVASAVIAVLGLGYLSGDLAAPPDQRIAASDDTVLLTSGATRPAADHELVAGLAGAQAAVTFLKFQVGALRGGTPPARAEVQLTRRAGKLPRSIELTQALGSRWRESNLTSWTAPRLGQVLDTVRPRAYDLSIVFDVTRVVRAAGSYSFAVTAPAGEGLARFVAKDAAVALDRLRPVLRLSWSPGPRTAGPPAVSGPGEPAPGDRGAGSGEAGCTVGAKLVPTCGVLWGVAPGAHTDEEGSDSLLRFERRTGRTQAIYHTYHRGDKMFPTPEEVAAARDPQRPRLLFVNWKPRGSWARIARGDPGTDAHLDRLARHIRTTFPERFFLTINHEPENDVRARPGSGRTADDYAAMYRYVVRRLRSQGATNIVPVMLYMSYVKWNLKPWFERLYPGDDVVDWVGWDTYAYSDPGYGHGDFAEMLNRRSRSRPQWPGFYAWASSRFPGKPLMIGEWGVWYSSRNPDHQARLFDSAAEQIALFPRLKALVYFETPSDQKGRDSRVDLTAEGLRAYQRLGQLSTFDVTIPRPAVTKTPPAGPPGPGRRPAVTTAGTGAAPPPSRSPSGAPAPR